MPKILCRCERELNVAMSNDAQDAVYVCKCEHAWVGVGVGVGVGVAG